MFTLFAVPSGVAQQYQSAILPDRDSNEKARAMSALRHSRAPEETPGLFCRTENHHKLLCLADLVEMLDLPIGLEDTMVWYH